MSDQAEIWATRQASAFDMPDPCLRRQVLMALAAKHESGPLTLPTIGLASHLQVDMLKIWTAIMELRRKGLLEASNIGGLMKVTLAFDFPDDTTASSSVLPQEQEGAL